jgi:KaiC
VPERLHDVLPVCLVRCVQGGLQAQASLEQVADQGKWRSLTPWPTSRRHRSSAPTTSAHWRRGSGTRPARSALPACSVGSLDAVFNRFADPGVVRRELARVTAALEKGRVTAVITVERADEYDHVSCYGVEEFVLDDVITLRNVLAHERRRRTIEVVKMRGAPHRTGEWLFTIDPRDGLVVIPLAFLVQPFAPAS